MKQHKMVRMVSAATAAVALLAALPSAALAQDGKSAADLAGHGDAQRIATIGSANAKNVILFIGDGMGDSEITVARDYLHGSNGTFDGLDKIGQPGALGDTSAATGQYTTYSLGNGSKDANNPVITPVTDSSASGSSWATGTKTYNNAVSIDSYLNPQLNLIELAKAKGLATGNVTTSEIQDATPAVQESHSTERSCYGPQGKADGSKNDAGKRCKAEQLKENGGIGSISEQLLDTRADVTIGGGSKYFNQTAQGGEYAGKTLWEQAQERGFQTVENDVDAFAALQYKEDAPVLALLSDGNMPTQFNNMPAMSQAATIARGAQTCSTNEAWLGNKTANGNSASLADMTSKALDLLKANPKSDNGFFLQVEGASIDKRDHAADACGQIGETDDLDKAISATLSSLEASGELQDTLIIVTADHAHTSQIVATPPAYAVSTILQSPVDGANIVVSYGTAGQIDPDADTEGYNDGGMGHTGTQLRIAASGPGASRVSGLTDQTDNFYTIAYALGLAATTEAQNALSDNGEVTVNEDGTNAEVTGFDGDAVLSYELKDANGVLAASNTSTPVSGVRVASGQTTNIALEGVQTNGTGYTLTVTGQQSGKQVVVTFDGPADNAGNGSTTGDKELASGSVKQTKPAKLGRTGAMVMGAVFLAAALMIAGALIVAYRRGAFNKR